VYYEAVKAFGKRSAAEVQVAKAEAERKMRLKA
jgi:hypothetical protein